MYRIHTFYVTKVLLHPVAVVVFYCLLMFFFFFLNFFQSDVGFFYEIEHELRFDLPPLPPPPPPPSSDLPLAFFWRCASCAGVGTIDEPPPDGSDCLRAEFRRSDGPRSYLIFAWFRSSLKTSPTFMLSLADVSTKPFSQSTSTRHDVSS